MKGDFSRLTFDVTKHFSRVLMQQGRVQLDADWNEQTAILLHYLQSLAKDLIGEHGGPADIKDGINVLKRNLGFEIIVDQKQIDKFSEDSEKIPLTELLKKSIPPIVIGKGHYYIDGILCENDRDLSFSDQPDYPWPKNKNLDQGNYLVYVDVWERHITYIEDDNIREVALGGPDTATRAKLVWQVKVTNKYWAIVDSKYVEKDIPLKPRNWQGWVLSNWNGWLGYWQPTNRGMLKARAKQDPKKDTDPCITSPEASYRGTENQLYRIEIHQGGNLVDQKPTFKWSRDNGSVVTIGKINGTELTVENPRGLSVGQWLELTNDDQELRGEVGMMVKINKIDCDIVSLENTDAPTPSVNLPPDEKSPTKARLWNSDQIILKEGNGDTNWFTLENGVQIQFQPSATAHQYRTGDYWLIPARVATGDVEWPGDVGMPESLPPHGIEHHYAPLAIVGNTTDTITIPADGDLRKQFESQAKDVK